ncbi:MAG: hypothetical protein COZ49_00195 [Candidatus Yonathbacteria bacterium CG_4_10_14_3_um_filter_47_65]|nr:MAG: hypothetical protein COX54_03645 [Candidatus Yonathbacteria bacterium CG23_combo_of_CG06-09_8_20_14_all_46_18]PIQ31862.1 MAG: hypothetical protein COW61_03185 [Candidatus Yonathbacteria bacterium CG17_big_fil_post_rev_8_21_14_2_50_46_19]PIX56793.1 MAG: hypothetical protein COZ49_00195 [Candidatus Yonathbacteria bacterium CG_4_10_14_3_um_filter_47_65]PJC21023.1 MAG: hypothetical protein CO061_00720 [Candidatus Yonathbacteria bacterium CG_4_9_14_0_2_um_filter_47_74]PJC67763.1 MAG: hypothe
MGEYFMVVMRVACCVMIVAIASCAEMPLSKDDIGSHVVMRWGVDNRAVAYCRFCGDEMRVYRTNSVSYRVECKRCYNLYVISYSGDISQTWQHAERSNQ